MRKRRRRPIVGEARASDEKKLQQHRPREQEPDEATQTPPVQGGPEARGEAPSTDTPANPRPVPSTRYPSRVARSRALRGRQWEESGPRRAVGPAGLLSSFVHPSEIEFARILDFYHVHWEYEPRSFPLRWDGDRVTEMFTPDFYLPDLDLYVELTTMKQSLVTRKNRKLRKLKELYPEVDVRLLYRRDYQSLLVKYGYRAITPTTMDEIDHILLSEKEIRKRIKELAAQISQDYAGKKIRLIGILKGVAFFMIDLMRELTIPSSIDFMFITKYHREDGESGAVRILKDLDQPIQGEHVLLVEDIVDTGFTLRYILNYLRARKPASLQVCTLLDKRARRLVESPLGYVAFEIPDEFVVGYGLDHREVYRNLPFLCVLKPEAYSTPTDGPQP